MVKRMEVDSYYRRFEGIELSPPKLNAVFQNYLEQFPGFAFDLTFEEAEGFKEFDGKDVNEALLITAQIFANAQMREERRENPNNEYKAALLNRMQGFLSRFAHTPASFDALIIDYLEHVYVGGLTETSFVNPKSFIHKLLDLSHPGGGLFNPERSHETMMECYSHIKEENERLDNLILKFEAKYGKKRMKLADRLIGKYYKDKYGKDMKFEESSLLEEFEEEYFGIQFPE